MSLGKNRGLVAAICGAALLVSPIVAAEEEPVTGDELDRVVVSLQQDPTEKDGLEAACVALQLGTGLLMSEQQEVNVTLFATLDGVYIADEKTYARRGRHGHDDDWDDDDGDKRGRHRRGSEGPICETFRDGELGRAPLRDILHGFLNAGGDVLLCPLCFAVRQKGGYELIEDPAIYVANPIPLLLDAKKVIDY